MSIKDEVKKALEHPVLSKALTSFSEAYLLAREKVYSGVDFEGLRDQIVQIKQHVVENLDQLIEKFTEQATKKGAKVFYAKHPEEAISYVVNLAKTKGVKSIVKSKSMATEEIHLNKHLEKEGIKVWETDLGEWIIQLAEQRPSHMVLPAIHLTRYEVSEIFSKKVNAVEPDIKKLVKFARKNLRQRFLEADMGITGANIAVAETGTLVIFTNEGNARLVLTLPKIHVAIVGIDKLVAKLEEVEPIIKTLPRNATAQPITTYVSFVTGERQHWDGTKKEVHIVLLDNGRSKMAKDSTFKEVFNCIRCASCLNVCPVYRLISGLVFGKVYTGGIGTILTAWTEGIRATKDISNFCIQCGNCVKVCPGRINIPDLILEIRKRLVEEEGLPLKIKAIYSVVNNRKLFHSTLKILSKLQKPFKEGPFIRHLPFALSEITQNISLPAIADKSFRERVKDVYQTKAREKVAFFAGCLIDFVYPEIGEALIKILEKAGIELVFPKQQTCCGAPALYSGVTEVALNNFLQNLEAFYKYHTELIISACPTCVVMLKNKGLKLLKDQKNLQEFIEKAEKVFKNVLDTATFINKLIKEEKIKFKQDVYITYTYHDSCHLKRSLHVWQEPRLNLEKAGFKLIEMFESDMCCGMGGSYSIKFPEISKKILERKLKNILDTGANLVCTDCPGCVLQIKGGVDKQNLNIEVKHSLEVLAESLE